MSVRQLYYFISYLSMIAEMQNEKSDTEAKASPKGDHVEYVTTLPQDLVDPHCAAFEDNPEHVEMLSLSVIMSTLVGI